jgi:hypothetical protein
LSILYGTTVRFYNTVVRWQDLDVMKEDLVETLTSTLFNDDIFSDLLLDMSRLTTFDEEKTFCRRLYELRNIKPIDIGISTYLTLDESCEIENVWKKLHPVDSSGDVGGSGGQNLQ